MSVHAHHEWQDSMVDWAMQNQLDAERKAELTADWGLADRNEGVFYAPQGRVEQGWPARRAWPEMAVYVPDDDAPRESMSGAEAWLLLLAYVASVLFTVWCFSMFAAYLKDWL